MTVKLKFEKRVKTQDWLIDLLMIYSGARAAQGRLRM